MAWHVAKGYKRMKSKHLSNIAILIYVLTVIAIIIASNYFG
jgi:hypothetical protein